MINSKDLIQTAAFNLSDEILSIRIEEFTRTLAIYLCYLLTAVSLVTSQGRRTRQVIDNLVNLYNEQWCKAPSFTTETVNLNQTTN